jgi:hypothetical protein
MRIKLRKHPLLKSLFFIVILSVSNVIHQTANAEVISIPIQRSVATQPVTQLEVIAIVKTILNGRVLSVKKQSSYTNPDCHHVKFLEDDGEFQMIELGCYVESIVQTQ